ncbi:MAG: glycosyltransferase [Rhodospirillales bacterium]|nr:glycosyltransferase [Rhodospirillales bacterium]MDE2318869.1 glycosyltransferase family 2 protein [Rhodospirillales bacterium]
MDDGTTGRARKAPPAPLPEFDEETYLRLNPDVLMAVAEGKFRSAREHYEQYGRAEGRLAMAPRDLPRDKIIITARPGSTGEAPHTPLGAVDTIKLSSAGGLFVTGWVNDSLDRLDSVELYVAGWSVAFSAASLARVRRPDADQVARLATPHALGFWGFIYAARRLPTGKCNAVMRLKSGAELILIVNIESQDDLDLRSTVLNHLASAQYPGPAYFNSVSSIGRAIGSQLVDFSQMLTRKAVSTPYIERFHHGGRVPKASVIVCLYGKPDYLALQQALFSRQAGAEDYEFIYVCNSQALAERLLQEAAIAQLAYGLDITLILLGANAGFAAANNLGAAHARAKRLVFMNPDVFPKEPDFARRHLAQVEDLPALRTDIFGAALYYSDGSLMHAGMYFEADTMPGFLLEQKDDETILRVEHYGKGAPPEDAALLRPRPVPAVTGAFISMSSAWFEELEGFSQDYIFGHYEDADLCLRSLEAGRPAWLADLRLYHLEGKGSARQMVHEGAAAVNRWLFTHSWVEPVKAALLGPAPVHPALAEVRP